MSILGQAAHDQLPQDLLLLYSSCRPEDAAFLAELGELERRNQRLRIVATMTQMEKSRQRWRGEARSLDAQLVKSASAGLPASICYVAGPPAMVEALRKTLESAGINADDIRSEEEFYGY